MNLKNANFKKLEEQNIFVTSQLKDLSEMTGTPTRRGLEQALLSDGEIVNVVSKNYGHLPNENFFLEVERNLIEADVNYKMRSLNRENRSFAVDYILEDENFHIEVKNGMDKLKPMLRFTNSYDGSTRTSGNFGFYREVCSNGLHVAESKIGFSVRHTGNIGNIVLPEIRGIVAKFMDNEFYTLKRKFEVLAETPVTNIADFVHFVTKENGLFKFEKSDTNPAPSLLAQTVIDVMKDESLLLGMPPNLWLGYNAFNEVIHGKLKKSFDQQRRQDADVFNSIFSLV
jgi:hypothetical protein